MTTPAKTRLIVGLLATLTLWPLAHLYLTARFEMSPWKLCGWGMYATPRFDQVGMEIYGLRDAAGGRSQLADPAPSVREEATRFLKRYRWLRRLASGDDLARLVLDTHPEWDAVEIVVFRPYMVPHTGMVEMRRAEYRHRRGV